MNRVRMIQLAAFFLLAAFVFPSFVLAGKIDWDVFTSLSPGMRQCLEQTLSKGQVAALAAGERPSSKKARKQAYKAYMLCMGRVGPASGGITPYDGPFFDAMSQIDETVNMMGAMSKVREAGVGKIALFARSRKRLHDNESALLRLKKMHPDIIVPGAPKFFQLRGDLSDAYINATVKGITKHNYAFVGEILYTHGDKKSGKQYSQGERYVDPTAPGTATLFKKLSPLRIPVMTHFEVYAPERDFPRFHTLFAAWPKQIFIVPHMAFGSPTQVAEFMDRHPNVYMTLSKKDRTMGDFSDSEKQSAIGAPLLRGAKLRPEWKALLIKYQDRLLAAVDAHMKKLWEEYPERVAVQRMTLGQLPREVAEKIAYKNAERVYGVRVK